MLKDSPLFRSTLFWDCNPEDISEEIHRDFILGRILEYGTLQDIQWVVSRYGKGRIKDFVLEKGARKLSPRTIRLWKLLLEE